MSVYFQTQNLTINFPLFIEKKNNKKESNKRALKKMADEAETTETKPTPTAPTTRTTTRVHSNKKEKEEVPDESFDEHVDYKQKYRSLKRKLKSLLYEQECFSEELRKTQRKCLRVSRDKSFLLDRLLQYEAPDLSSDDDATDSSSDDDITERRPATSKKSTSAKSNKTVKSTTKGSTTATGGGDNKIRCKHTDGKSGKRCSKLVSKKIGSGICQTHRQHNNVPAKDKDAKPKTPPLSAVVEEKTPVDDAPVENNLPPPVKRAPTGGKDIGQFREAMEASTNQLDDSDSSNNDDDDEDEEDELIIDVP